MGKKMNVKKLLSLVLTVIMVLGMLPMAAFAAEGESDGVGLSGFILHTGAGIHNMQSTALIGDANEKYPKRIEFEPETLEYTIEVPDLLLGKRFNIVAVPKTQEATVTVHGVASKNNGEMTDSKEMQTSSKLDEYQSANSFYAMNTLKKHQFSVEVQNPKNGGKCTYTFTIKMKPTLTALSLTSGGEPVYLKEAFDAKNFEYSTDISQNMQALTVNAVPKNAGYTLTYGGEQSNEVDLSSTSSIPVVLTYGEGADKIESTYTIKLNKLEEYSRGFNLTPPDASLLVVDEKNAVLAPGQDGLYSGLLPGNNYRYSVTKYGYVSKVVTFDENTTNENGIFNVNLDEATNPSSPLPSYKAEWPNLRGNPENNAVVDYKTPTTQEEANLKWSIKLGTGWGASPTPPIMVNDQLYTASSKYVYILNPKDGSTVKQSEALPSSIGFASNPITYAEGMIFVQIDNGRIVALRADTLEQLWVTETLRGEQTISPITYHNGYIYLGTWRSETAKGTLFCVSVTDENPAKTDEIKPYTWKMTHPGGFYWAGAYVTDNYLIIGSDDGSASGEFTDTAILYAIHPTTGQIIDKIENIKGDIRSSIAYDKESGRVYFSTKGGVFGTVKVNDDGTFDRNSYQTLQLNGMCTGTPLIYNGRAYIGVAGASQFAGSGHCIYVIDVASSQIKIFYSAKIAGYPQASALASTGYAEANGKVYVYITYNKFPGGIYMIEDKPGQTEAIGDHLFTPPADLQQFCICSLVCDSDGTLYYKNDSGYLMAVERVASAETPVKPPVVDDTDDTKKKDEAADGTVIGSATVSVEAFTIGGGYVIEPVAVEIRKGENAAKLLDRLLKANGFGYEKTGTLDANFYLKAITGGTIPSLPTDMSQVPEYIKSKLTGPFGGRNENSLGEFDFTSGSGWMYSVNAVFPDVGFADWYLKDGDVMRVQFTLCLGEDIGGGKAVDGDNGNNSGDKATELQNPYADVGQDDWFYDAVMYVSQNGLMIGDLTDKFEPHASMTRAMLVTVLYRIEGEPVVTAANTFSDVADGQWYTNAIIWASGNGIVEGYGNGLFGTNNNVTREQISTILYRYAEKKGRDISKTAELEGYSDAAQISKYAQRAMQWANAEGLITGRTSTTLVPNGTATRAELATLLMRYNKKAAPTTLSGAYTPAIAAASGTALPDAITDTAQYMYKTVKTPQVGSIGGEWAILGLARSGYELPEKYYQDYYATVEAYVKACGGKLHDKKYTEYSRVIVALSSIGKDARSVAGYDLTKALGDYDKTIWQGMNGPIWALLALDSADYPMPQNPEAKTQATRQMYVDRILTCQLPDGGWSLLGGTSDTAKDASDPDITGMALQALAKYQNQPAVAKSTSKALACMSKMQDKDGGYSSWGTENSESIVQMIVALCELGIPLDDPRFVKGGKTMLDNLMSFYQVGNGFLHTSVGKGSNQMASEQALYGLVAAQRARDGKNSLYRMGDAKTIADGEGKGKGAGLDGKHKDVKAVPITAPGTSFDDALYSPNITAIEALAARQIINGKNGGLFEPDANMTRAEFAAIVVRALGLAPAATNVFTDVAEGVWYAPYIGTAFSYGIIKGVGEGLFNPEGTITRQEAAVMLSRAAVLCGMDTKMDKAAIRDALAQFADYMSVADWSREGLAFCYREDIFNQSDLEIQPAKAIKRCEIAQALFNLLGSANLL